MPDKSLNQLTKRTSKSARQITKNGDVFELEEGVVTDGQNVLVTNVTIHVVNPDEEKGILMRCAIRNKIAKGQMIDFTFSLFQRHKQ